ncbi:sulfatase [Catenovulum agarivorans]|uniref:sulfatase family protein n=1 Tax=Catenovulum agarivorans TaxID=1172192 RepID=UPI0002EB1AEB|nr:sulfatase [Catenovulum agarivorans]
MKKFKLAAVLTSLILTACNSTSNTQRTAAEQTNTSKQTPPNVVIILSDDHAWNDYGFMGSPHVNTPALDKLAAEGVTFSRGYVPTSLCRPSLATIATGLYASQHLITGNDPAPSVYGKKNSAAYNAAREQLISNIDRVATLPQMLREKGYVSLQTGKWWEGSYKRGGFDQGMTRGFPEKGGRHGDDGLKIGREGMEIVTNFIDQAKADNKPFFVWYAPYMPHAPHTPPERILNKYQGKGYPEPVAKYYAMVEWFDETNGQLMDHLDKTGLKDNTLVVYVSDNGWIQNPNKSHTYLTRSKMNPDEAGVRTPIIYSLPSQFKAQMRNEMTSSIDIVPTILGAAGIEVPAGLPGLNLFETLKQQKLIQRNTIYGEGYGHDVVDLDNIEGSLLYRWVIEDDWKLILSYDGENPRWTDKHSMIGEPRLYNLAQDQYETTNLAEKNPKIVKRLAQKLVDWYPVTSRKLLTK